MKLIDITRELTGAPVFPGDPAPRVVQTRNMVRGDLYNLTELHMPVHSGTHMDAPLHFVPDGAAVGDIPLAALCGDCYVMAYDGVLTGAAAEQLLADGVPERLLLKGNAALDPSAAFVLTHMGVRLLGVEPPSVAAPEDTVAVHRQLLGSGMLLLENLDLSGADAGRYTLMALPLKIGCAEGAPVRAVLLQDQPLVLEEGFLRRG